MFLLGSWLSAELNYFALPSIWCVMEWLCYCDLRSLGCVNKYLYESCRGEFDVCLRDDAVKYIEYVITFHDMSNMIATRGGLLCLCNETRGKATCWTEHVYEFNLFIKHLVDCYLQPDCMCKDCLFRSWTLRSEHRVLTLKYIRQLVDNNDDSEHKFGDGTHLWKIDDAYLIYTTTSYLD